MKRIILVFVAIVFIQNTYSQYLEPKQDNITKKYGYKEKGNSKDWSLPAIYDVAYYYWDNLAEVAIGDKYFFIDLHGVMRSPFFNKCTRPYTPFYPNLCKNEEGLYNAYDLQFNPLFKNSYSDLFYLVNKTKFGLLKFRKNGKYGIMDLGENILVPAIYNDIQPMSVIPKLEEKCNKDGIEKDLLYMIFFEVENDKYKHGLINLSNDIIVPVKYHSYQVDKVAISAYEKKIKPYINSLELRTVKDKVIATTECILENNKTLASIYPTDLPKIIETTIKESDEGYAFYKEDVLVSKIYQNIEKHGDCCVVINGKGKYELTDLLGREITQKEYDNICVWMENDYRVLLLAESNGKYDLLNSEGKALQAQNFDIIFQPSNNVGVGMKKGLFWLIDLRGNIISNHGYDDIDNFSENRINAEWMGYKTELTESGKELSPIAKQVFDEAYDIPIGYAQEKYDKYMLSISMDSDNILHIKESALNNIGSMFEELGDLDSAMQYYELSKQLGNNKGKENVRRLRLNRIADALQSVSNAITQSINTIGVNGNSQYENINSSVKENNIQSANGHSYSYWKQQYDRWERNAKSCYESLTNTGYKTQKNGKDVGGSSAGSWGSVNFSGMKSNLRKAQREMSDIRAKARKEGHSIPQSTYETVNVSY